MKTLTVQPAAGDVGALLESKPGRGFGAVAEYVVLELDRSSPAGSPTS